MMRKLLLRQKALLAVLLLCDVVWICGMLPPPAKAQNNAAEQPQDDDSEQSWKNRKFEYKLDKKGSPRSDPFYPFLSKELAQKNEGDKLVEVDGKTLTGMQLFEPGQLKLVAVMNTPDGKIAMAEDVTGKGYMLQKDMLIGAYGQIVDIEGGQVVIEETRKTQSGRVLQNEIIMRLNKDEDKKKR
jgi:Tfp pilus assembly protein PilP